MLVRYKIINILKVNKYILFIINDYYLFFLGNRGCPDKFICNSTNPQGP